ncbi:hypothetical protein CERZMDRAFT_99086 [Cercospora zeae-maydis SCOH1-5]|uniref:Cep57 centrosome microtubule-binding domain-containing protein n=1 Tax=Cercospora zeae-maydis SCOH1-5 TaxID=717836 RepID=A0A6A6FBY8_9PEZI|nr:hypothetical protein CERZMDRAFT_99086 [Cercospora zeae-maydis SCOH1-5]
MSRFSRGRAASPYDDNIFATATETSFKDLLHSTPQRDYAASQHAFPLEYNQHPSPQRATQDDTTLGSTEMSIELGRGVKRSQPDHADLSSNAVFSFERTPPGPSRGHHRGVESGLRKEAAVRRATESTRANDALKRSTHRAVSESLPRTRVDNEPAQNTATFSIRGSRFAGVRQVSSQYNVPKRYTTDGALENANSTPRRAAIGNPTVQSFTYTSGQSFMLPDLPNITELVSGPNEATPLVQRTSTSRTRFVSGTHRTVNTMRVPQDEQAIFASLQMLSDRVAQLELEKSEAQKHVEDYEHEVIELRAQLGVQRPDSGLGSEDNDTAPTEAPDKTRLQAKVKAAEERLHRTERKISISEITVTRVTKERDHLIQQLASSYVANDELENQNGSLRKSVSDVLAENEELKLRLRELEDRNSSLLVELERLRTARTSGSLSASKETGQRSRGTTGHENIAEGLTISNTMNSRKDAQRNTSQHRHRSIPQLNETVKQDLAARIQTEVERQRDAAVAATKEASDRPAARGSRSRSRSQQRRQQHDTDAGDHPKSGAKDTTEHSERVFATEASYQSRRSSRHADKFEEDLTQLTDLDPVDVANLRRKLEDEMRARHSQKYDRAHAAADSTVRSVTQRSVTRKSSLKDATVAHEGTAQNELTKTVRVQSPHTADEISHSGHDTVGDVSSISNTGRRRRRSATNDGLTSAFIVPDITVAMGGVAMPVAVTDRSVYNPDATNITVRPSQAPILALATVIRHLEEETSQLKAKRDVENKAYATHDPSMARRVRIACLGRIEALTQEIERRSDQVYALYDVLEAHKGEIASVEQNKDAGERHEDDVEGSELAFEGFSETDGSEESREVRI